MQGVLLTTDLLSRIVEQASASKHGAAIDRSEGNASGEI
jgi:hypothetical protein